MDFVDFYEYLSKITKMSSEECKLAHEHVQMRFYELHLQTHGPCIICRKVEIDWWPSKEQIARGDAWLQKLYDHFLGEIYVSLSDKLNRRSKSNYLIGGYGENTIHPYMCNDCALRIDSIYHELLEKRERESA